MGTQAGKNVLDVFDGEYDATDAQRVRRCVSWLSARRYWPMELRQLEPTVAIGGPHHCDVDSDAAEADDAVHPTSLDWRFALQFQTNCSVAPTRQPR
jgi:hypothetical protein